MKATIFELKLGYFRALFSFAKILNEILIFVKGNGFFDQYKIKLTPIVYMKKIVTIIVLFVTVFVASCSKDEASIDGSESIVGRWVLQEMQELNTMKKVPYTDGIEYSFKADGTFTGITVEIDFDEIEPVWIKVPVSGKYKFSSDRQEITIAENGRQQEVFDVYTLTTKKMILRGKYQDFEVQSTFSKK